MVISTELWNDAQTIQVSSMFENVQEVPIHTAHGKDRITLI